MDKLDFLAIEFLKILVEKDVTKFRVKEPVNFSGIASTQPRAVYDATATAENFWRAYRQIRDQLEDLEASSKESSD